MHRFLLHNGQIHATSEKLISPGQVGFLNGWGVFSTLRIFDGVLFAYERHWARMHKDAELLHVPMPADSEELRRHLLALIEANGAYNSTLRVAIVRNRGGFFEGEGIERDYDVVAFTTDLHHWGRGVRLAVQADARHGACPLAGAKITSWAHNLTWLENARRRGFDEVLLLDEHGRVSECTSANVFAATPEGVLTPPLSSGCLPGVTREVLLREAVVPSVPVIEKHLTVEDLHRARAVFITSTTRELLPVASLEDTPLNQDDHARTALQDAFSSYADHYVAVAHRSGHGAARSAAR